jgi:hypothetical protein
MDKICPYCQSQHLIKNGSAYGVPTRRAAPAKWKCKDCLRQTSFKPPRGEPLDGHVHRRGEQHDVVDTASVNLSGSVPRRTEPGWCLVGAQYLSRQRIEGDRQATDIYLSGPIRDTRQKMLMTAMDAVEATDRQDVSLLR